MPTLAGMRRRGVPPAAMRDFVTTVGVAPRQQRRRYRDVRARDPRPSQQDGAAAHGGAAAAQGRDRELPTGRARSSTRSIIPTIRPPGTRRIPFGREIYHRARRFHGEPAEEILPPVAGRRGAAALRLFHHLPRGGEGCEPARWWSCAAPTIPRRAAATRRMGARSRRRSIGSTRATSLPAEIRLYNPLFTRPDPGAGGDLMADLNPNSLEVLTGARLEPSLGDAKTGEAIQFERQGYFAATRIQNPASRSSTAPSACATVTRRRKRRGRVGKPLIVIASEAKQSRATRGLSGLLRRASHSSQ